PLLTVDHCKMLRAFSSESRAVLLSSKARDLEGASFQVLEEGERTAVERGSRAARSDQRFLEMRDTTSGRG
ncbi:MAG: hypothetical protein WA761_03150, partial [Thermoplasmata archaeon]